MLLMEVTWDNIMAECGCESGDFASAHLLSLEKISLFRHCGFLLKMLCKAEEPNGNNLLSTKQY